MLTRRTMKYLIFLLSVTFSLSPHVSLAGSPPDGTYILSYIEAKTAVLTKYDSSPSNDIHADNPRVVTQFPVGGPSSEIKGIAQAALVLHQDESEPDLWVLSEEGKVYLITSGLHQTPKPVSQEKYSALTENSTEKDLGVLLVQENNNFLVWVNNVNGNPEVTHSASFNNLESKIRAIRSLSKGRFIALTDEELILGETEKGKALVVKSIGFKTNNPVSNTHVVSGFELVGNETSAWTVLGVKTIAGNPETHLVLWSFENTSSPMLNSRGSYDRYRNWWGFQLLGVDSTNPSRVNTRQDGSRIVVDGGKDQNGKPKNYFSDKTTTEIYPQWVTPPYKDRNRFLPDIFIFEPK